MTKYEGKSKEKKTGLLRGCIDHACVLISYVRTRYCRLQRGA